MGMFYADYGMIGSRDLEWLQGVINVLIGLLRRVGLMSKISKSKTMTCQTGEICMGFQIRLSVGGTQERKAYTRSVYVGAFHVQTAVWI